MMLMLLLLLVLVFFLEVHVAVGAHIHPKTRLKYQRESVKIDASPQIYHYDCYDYYDYHYSVQSKVPQDEDFL